MEHDHNGISNLEFPVSHVIREALHALPEQRKQELLESLSEDEFVSMRVDTYLHELETAMHNGYDEAGAQEIAMMECLAGLTPGDE